MSTSAPPIYNYYQPYASNAGYNTTSKPTQAAKNEAEFAVNTGGQLLAQQQALANQYGQEQAGTQNYLNPIEGQLASGQGGYSPEEASQIELTPAQKQDIITSAGISAGQGNAAAVNAAERAYAATGGNPAALATYRARAAQSEAANAGQAETGAKVAAQQAGSAGAQAVGNARLAQQNQGLNYYGNLQAQQGGQQATEQGLGNQTFGTEVGGLGSATGHENTAAGIPTTADKIIGGIAGAASAFLEDGTSGYLDDGQDAVVGENGMEAVIEDAPKAVVRGASDPVRSHTTFMDEGHYRPENNPPWSSGGRTYLDDGYIPGAPPIPPTVSPAISIPGADMSGIAPPEAPLPYNAGGTNAALSQETPGFGTAKSGMPVWLQQALANNQGKQPSSAPQPGQPGWNKTTPYSQLGSVIGSIAKQFVQKGAGGAQPGGQSGAASSGGGFQNPISGGGANTGASALPGGIPGGPSLINRTGDVIDGVPSLGSAASDLGDAAGLADAANAVGTGAADLGSEAASGLADAGSGIADVAGALADGRMPYLEDGAPSSKGFFTGAGGPIFSSLIGPGGIGPLGSLLADGSSGYLQDGAPEEAEYRADPQNSSEVSRLISRESSMAADGKMMAGGRMGSGFHWSNRMPHAPRVPTGGYQPLHYDAKPILADGSMAQPQSAPADTAAVDNPMAAMGEPQNGQQVGRAKIFTKPTLIHLEKADAVVPLTYRPKAKVRPSAALPALMDRPHRFYGARA